MAYLPVTLAGYRVLLNHQYDFVAAQCRDYLTDFSPAEADLEISVSPEAVAFEMAQSPRAYDKVTPGYAESVCLYRSLCSRLPERGGMLLHAAVIRDGHVGYGFSAPSGTGKSTHIALWRKAFGPHITVVNGDKPILRLIDQTWWAYGTPWCGKEGWNTNTRVPLKGLCFLSRGDKNVIQRLSPKTAVPMLLRQVLLSMDATNTRASMALLDHLATHIPLYQLFCTKELEAATVAREAMSADL